MKPFQIVLMSVFMVLAVGAVMVFALGGGLNKVATPSAVVWGTLNTTDVEQIISKINSNGPVVEVHYEEHDPAKIDQDFVNALAEGTGPDIIIFSDEKLLKHKSKLYTIPYTVLTQRNFMDTYIDASSIYMTKDGILGIPFAVDPMVMYWNKTIFNTAGLSLPPTKWSDLPALATKLIRKNAAGGVDRALVSLGEYRNVNNAKDILATLFFQSRNPISIISGDNDAVSYVLDQQDSSIGDVIPAIDFYSSFSNPSSPVYSWNLSEPNSSEAFSAGDLALYFGHASELAAIRAKNPNLNFDVAPMLQDDSADSTLANSGPVSNLGIQNQSAGRVVKGTLHSMSIVKSSKNIAGAFTVLQYLVNADSQNFWSSVLSIPPVRRDLLSTEPSSPYQAVFYRSAIQSKTWLDPDAAESDRIFQDMIESVTTGKSRSSEVVSTLTSRLQNLYINK